MDNQTTFSFPSFLPWVVILSIFLINCIIEWKSKLSLSKYYIISRLFLTLHLFVLSAFSLLLFSFAVHTTNTWISFLIIMSVSPAWFLGLQYLFRQIFKNDEVRLVSVNRILCYQKYLMYCLTVAFILMILAMMRNSGMLR